MLRKQHFVAINAYVDYGLRLCKFLKIRRVPIAFTNLIITGLFNFSIWLLNIGLCGNR